MRPKKTESQRLTKTVLFRLTELEEAQLKRTAAQCGMSVSDYCRAAIFGTTPKQRLTPEQQKLLEEVREIRWNMSRITNHWRSRDWPDVRLELDRIIEKLKPLNYDSKLQAGSPWRGDRRL